MQDQWQVPFLLRHLAGGQDLQAAIDAPMWHTTHHVASFEPRTVDVLGLHVEDRAGEDVIADLRRRGHLVTVTGPWSLGTAVRCRHPARRPAARRRHVAWRPGVRGGSVTRA